MTRIEHAIAIPLRRIVPPWKLATGGIITFAGLATLIADASHFVG